MPIIRRRGSRSNGWRWESVESGIVDVEISGPDADRLLALGERVRSLLQAAPGIRDNDDDWGNKIVKVVVEIDQDRARQLGVTSEEVTQLLNTYFSGTAVSIYREGDNAHSDRAARRSVHLAEPGRPHQRHLCEKWRADLAGAGRQVEARIRSGAHPPQEPGTDDHGHRPQHVADRRAVAGSDPARPAGAGPCRRAIMSTIGGEIQKSAETNQKLAAGFPVALAVMVLAIILQFNSFRRTLLTFMSIPLILIGIPFGLLAAGQPLSFFGTLGIISLSGIIINNAIVLIDQIDIEREKLPLREAIVAASEKRLRPILLTSATTVLGLAPMAIAGGALWQPMAVLMMSGLAVASLLTLFFVPAGYFLLFWFDKDLPPAPQREP